MIVYGEFIVSPQVKYANLLVKHLPEKLDNVYFTSSGSEAVEGALKLAKRYTGRTEIIAFQNAYHGSTHGALSVMGNETFKQAFRPLLPDVRFIEFNNDKHLEQITSKTACVIVEPIQGEAGVILPMEDVIGQSEGLLTEKADGKGKRQKGNYLQQLRKRCDETGTLLIFDEIQTGMGRTGKLFAFEKYKVVPDILCLAKAFGGGMPLGAFISSKEIMSTLSHNPVLGHITTFGGHPLSCAAGMEAFKIISSHPDPKGRKATPTSDGVRYSSSSESSDLKGESGTRRKCAGTHTLTFPLSHPLTFSPLGVGGKGELFKKLLVHPRIKEVRGEGLLLAVQFTSEDENKKIISRCIENGVITDWFLFCPSAMRIAPPLIITEKQIVKACEVILSAVGDY